MGGQYRFVGEKWSFMPRVKRLIILCVAPVRCLFERIQKSPHLAQTMSVDAKHCAPTWELIRRDFLAHVPWKISSPDAITSKSDSSTRSANASDAARAGAHYSCTSSRVRNWPDRLPIEEKKGERREWVDICVPPSNTATQRNREERHGSLSTSNNKKNETATTTTPAKKQHM